MGGYKDRVILTRSMPGRTELFLQFYSGRGKFLVFWLTFFFFILRFLIILVIWQMSVWIYQLQYRQNTFQIKCPVTVQGTTVRIRPTQPYSLPRTGLGSPGIMKDSFLIKIISLEERARVKKKKSPRGRITLWVIGEPENKSTQLENAWRKAGKPEFEVDRGQRLKKLEGHLKDKPSLTTSNLEPMPYKI